MSLFAEKAEEKKYYEKGDKFTYNNHNEDVEATVLDVYNIDDITKEVEDEYRFSISDMKRDYPGSTKIYIIKYMHNFRKPNNEGIKKFVNLHPEYEGDRIPIHIRVYIRQNNINDFNINELYEDDYKETINAIGDTKFVHGGQRRKGSRRRKGSKRRKGSRRR